MDFSDLGEKVKKFAPSLGMLLTGNLYGAASSALAAAFGGDANNPDDLAQRIDQDPQAQIKLAEIESNFKLAMRNADVEEYKTQVGDVQNARQRVIELAKAGIRDYMTEILALLIIAGYFVLNYHFAASTDHESKQVLQSLRDLAILVASYYFGSSRGERRAMSQ